MELWINGKAIKLDLNTNKQIKLKPVVQNALEKGDLIFSLEDPRNIYTYVRRSPHVNIPSQGQRAGTSQSFYDFTPPKDLTRSEFVGEIKLGYYRCHGAMIVNKRTSLLKTSVWLRIISDNHII